MFFFVLVDALIERMIQRINVLTFQLNGCAFLPTFARLHVHEAGTAHPTKVGMGKGLTRWHPKGPIFLSLSPVRSLPPIRPLSEVGADG